MAGPQKSTTPRNEGEGNRTAAREYNKDQQEFVKGGKVGQAAREAEKAVEGREKDALEKAEKAGKSRIHERDPEVARDYTKKS